MRRRVVLLTAVVAVGLGTLAVDGDDTVRAALASSARQPAQPGDEPTTAGDDPFAGARALLDAGYEQEAREAAIEAAKADASAPIPGELRAPARGDPYAGAQALFDAGHKDEARAEAKEIAESNPGEPIPARLRPVGRGLLKDTAGWLTDVLTPLGVVLGTGVLAIAVLNMVLLRWHWWRWPRPRVAIKPMTVADGATVPSEALTQMLTDEMAANGSGHDINRVADAAANTGVDLARSLPGQWEWLTPVLRYLNPRKVLTVSGEATLVTTRDPATNDEMHEATVSVTITNFRAQVVATRAFPVRRSDVDPADLLRSQVPMAGAWLMSELRKQGATRRGPESGWFGTVEWWSWGQFRQGVWYSDHQYDELADARYRAAVVSDLRNAAAWLNLASRNARNERFDEAIQELDAVRHRIEGRDGCEVLWLRYLNLRAVALLNRAASSRGTNPGRDRVQARECAVALVRAIASAQLEFEDELDKPWLRFRQAMRRHAVAVRKSSLRPRRLVHFALPPKERDPELHDLVDGTEATALALLASAVLTRDELPDVDPQPDPSQKRKASFTELAGVRADVGVNRVLTLLAGIRSDARGNDRSEQVAYLDALDPRAHYNLGCLYARAAQHAATGRPRTDLLDAALKHLERGIADSRKRAAWARRDPELAQLRADPVAKRQLDDLVDRVDPRPQPAPLPLSDGWRLRVGA